MKLLMVEDVRELLRREVKRAGSQSAWARQFGIYPSYVNTVMHGKRPPGKNLLKALKLRKVIAYKGIGAAR